MAADPRVAAALDYRDAQRLFAAGEYRRALRLFRRAHEAAPSADILYGTARCYVELGHYDRAIEFYDTLLQSHPGYSEREGVEQALTELRSLIADLDEADDAPSRGPTVIAGGNAYVFNGGIRDIGDIGNIGDRNNQTDVNVQTTRMSRGRKISWGVLASGLAITAIGAGLLIRGAVLYQDYKETSSRQLDDAGWNDLREVVHTAENSFKAGWGLTISGLAISCVSTLLLVFLPGEELLPGGSGSRANVHLSLTGMSFTGSF